MWMETVTHREMRNRSGEILRRVEAGESVRVSNNGHLAALIVPEEATHSTVSSRVARPDLPVPRLRLLQRSDAWCPP